MLTYLKEAVNILKEGLSTVWQSTSSTNSSINSIPLFG